MLYLILVFRIQGSQQNGRTQIGQGVSSWYFMLPWWPEADDRQYQCHATTHYKDWTGKAVMQHLPVKLTQKGKNFYTIIIFNIFLLLCFLKIMDFF